MAVTQSNNTPTVIHGPNGKRMETGILTWTSTTATAELSTKLSVIEGASFARVGGTDVDDLGLLTIDETVTNGKIEVSGGAITIDRDLATGTGTLTGESHMYILVGY